MTPRFAWLILWQGTLLGASTLAAFALGMRWYGTVGLGLKHAVTMAFMTLALAQVFHAFNARSRTRSLVSVSSRTGGSGVPLTPLAVVEVVKAANRWRQAKPSPPLTGKV